MRGYVPAYDLRTPKNLKEALSLVSEGFRPFAGGTDLMVLFEAGKLDHKNFVSLHGLKEFRGITEDKNFVTLGAATTYGEIRDHKTLGKEFPSLVEAARETGALAIQNRGTLGGNIANASPAADSPPALLVYDAQLGLVSSEGERWVEYLNFHTDYKVTALKKGELISKIRLLRTRKKRMHYYRKVGTRRAQAISKVCFAGAAGLVKRRVLEDVRIALGSVAPTPVRAVKVEQLLNHQKLTPELVKEACTLLQREITPIQDIRSDAQYRRQVAANLLCEFISRMTGVELDSKTS